MNELEKIRVFENSLDHQISMIRAADSRSSLALALNTGMLGVLAAIFPKDPNNWTCLPLVLGASTIILILLSLLSLTLASFPRVKGPSDSIIFFRRISERSIDDFAEDALKLTKDDYLRDLLRQTHRNAEIAASKFYWVQRVFIFLYLAVLPWAGAIYLIIRT